MYKLIKTLIWFLLLSGYAHAANYTLQVVRPDSGIGTADRIYKAYTGITYSTMVAVFGGLYPFTYALSNAPSGMTVDVNGVITWVNPQSSASNIVVTVTDAESNTDTGTWSITVGTNGFYFVDASVGDGGDGSYNDPWNDWTDFYLGQSDSTYDDAIIYFYDGTYTYPSAYTDGTTGDSNRLFISAHPKSYLAYPGETVVYFDGERTTNKIHLVTTEDNVTFDSINFKSGYGYNIQNNGGDYMNIINCTFDDTSGSGSASNQSQILYREDAPTNGNTAPGTNIGFKIYGVIQNNEFKNTLISETGIKTYGTRHLIIDGNSFHDISNDAIMLKSTTDRTMIRHNTFSNLDGANSLVLFEQFYTSNTDISFNFFNSKRLTIGSAATGTIEQTYIYRNTIVGDFQFDEIDSGEGPFYNYTNVIINSYTDSGSPGDADYYTDHVWWQDSIDATSITTVTDNLTGVAADNIVDGDGLLLGTYRTTYLGITGWEINDEPESSTPNLQGVTIQ